MLVLEKITSLSQTKLPPSSSPAGLRPAFSHCRSAGHLASEHSKIKQLWLWNVSHSCHNAAQGQWVREPAELRGHEPCWRRICQTPDCQPCTKGDRTNRTWDMIGPHSCTDSFAVARFLTSMPRRRKLSRGGVPGGGGGGSSSSGSSWGRPWSAWAAAGAAAGRGTAGHCWTTGSSGPLPAGATSYKITGWQLLRQLIRRQIISKLKIKHCWLGSKLLAVLGRTASPGTQYHVAWHGTGPCQLQDHSTSLESNLQWTWRWQRWCWPPRQTQLGAAAPTSGALWESWRCSIARPGSCKLCAYYCCQRCVLLLVQLHVMRLKLGWAPPARLTCTEPDVQPATACAGLSSHAVETSWRSWTLRSWLDRQESRLRRWHFVLEALVQIHSKIHSQVQGHDDLDSWTMAGPQDGRAVWLKKLRAASRVSGNKINCICKQGHFRQVWLEKTSNDQTGWRKHKIHLADWLEKTSNDQRTGLWLAGRGSSSCSFNLAAGRIVATR